MIKQRTWEEFVPPSDIEQLYQEGIAAIRDGNTEAGRERLMQVLKLNGEHEQAWLWLSATLTTTRGRAYCLKNVLRINPNSQAARRGLEQLGISMAQIPVSRRPPTPPSLPLTPSQPKSTGQTASPVHSSIVAPSVPVSARQAHSATTLGALTAAPRAVAVPRRGRIFSLPNIHLLIGLVVVGMLLFVALFGSRLAPRDPMESKFLWQASDGKFFTPPFDPFEFPEFPLGTDSVGRDTLSRLLWGVRPTLILAASIALGRLILGTFLGIMEGWFSKSFVGRISASLTQAAISFPLLILAIVVLQIIGMRGAGTLGPFILALNLTGWANIAQSVSERVRVMKSELYIEASRALGAGNIHIIWKHVVPQVRNLLLILLSFEMGATLLQLAELGFLGFYLGGGAFRDVPDPASTGFIQVLIPGHPELGQMLSAGWDNFFLAPWMAVWAGTAFFLAVFGFMTLGEGLKRYYAAGHRISGLKRLSDAIFKG